MYRHFGKAPGTPHSHTKYVYSRCGGTFVKHGLYLIGADFATSQSDARLPHKPEGAFLLEMGLKMFSYICRLDILYVITHSAHRSNISVLHQVFYLLLFLKCINSFVL